MFSISPEAHLHMMESEAKRIKQKAIEKKEVEVFNKNKSKFFIEVKNDENNLELKNIKKIGVKK